MQRQAIVALLLGFGALGCSETPADLDGGAEVDAGNAGAMDASPARDAARVEELDAGLDAHLLEDGGFDSAVEDAGPPTRVETVDVWVWNVAGNTMHRGATDDGLIEAAVSSIGNRSADFAAFNELCFTQYRALQTALRAAGWPEDTDNFSRFSETRPGSASICRGTAYGNAIFSRRPLGSADDIELPSDGRPEHRTMLCAPLASLPHLRFCTTHITTSNEVGTDGFAANSRQLRAVLDQLERYHRAGDTVIIGGDFNAQPHYGRMNRFYAPSLDVPANGDNAGQYRELDDDDAGHCLGYGEKTTEDDRPTPCGDIGAKIDLIFVRESALAGPYSADSLSISSACGGPCSDHRILIGTATLRVRD